jgi:hypothetical protein
MADNLQVLSEGWHLDKKVPLGMIFALLVYGGTFLWWASKLDNRVGALEKAITGTSQQEGRIIRNETRIDGVNSRIDEVNRVLSRIENKLDTALSSTLTNQ